MQIASLSIINQYNQRQSKTQSIGHKLEPGVKQTFLKAGEKICPNFGGIKSGLGNTFQSTLRNNAISEINTKKIEEELYKKVLEVAPHLEGKEYSDFVNEIIQKLRVALTKDAGSEDIILKRIALLDTYFIGSVAFENKNNVHVLLDNYNIVKQIENNLMDLFQWDTYSITGAITKENIHEVLEASLKAAQKDPKAIDHLHYIQYSSRPHNTTIYSNETVDIDSKIIMDLLSGHRCKDSQFFDSEIAKLFTSEVNMLEKKAYGMSLKGILEQKPELVELATKAENMSKNEYVEFCRTLPPTLTFKKFSPDQKLEARTVLGAFRHMKELKGVSK